MAAGKSTVAQAVATRLEPGVHLRGDVFRRMIVSGRADMTAEADAPALAQLRLRYGCAADVAKRYFLAGFNVVYQDVIVGPILTEVVALYAELPLQVVVLCPSAEAVAQREAQRAKTGYHSMTIAQMQELLTQTPRLGHWLDSSKQTLDETVQAVLQLTA